MGLQSLPLQELEVLLLTEAFPQASLLAATALLLHREEKILLRPISSRKTQQEQQGDAAEAQFAPTSLDRRPRMAGQCKCLKKKIRIKLT